MTPRGRRAVPARGLAAVALAAFALSPQAAGASDRSPAPIDRRAGVSRPAPVLHALDPEAPLSVGNGELAFTADVTGLQTFAEAYEHTIPLGTFSQWGWHTAPNPDRWSIDAFRFREFDSHGRRVGYADVPSAGRTPEVEWLRNNPHRLHLGRLGFRLLMADGRAATQADVTDVEQRLDLWEGVLRSRFRIEGKPVSVETICDPRRDVLAVRVRSPLVRQGRVGVRLLFPYGTPETSGADWGRPGAHTTVVTRVERSSARFDRRLDHDAYAVAASWAPAGRIEQTAVHEYLVMPARRTETFDFAVEFTPGRPARALRPFEVTRSLARAHWRRFWLSGGAIDLSGSRDPRWHELERRIVLSQYLTAIQCAGSSPPAESGLTFDSWAGKFHLEMHWWHAAHFALWGRHPLLEKSLGYYAAILPRARATARRQGYSGARWPKMTDRSGAESPSPVGPFLIWQQPHPIFYAELLYRARPDRATLERLREIVFDSADFMASFAAWDQATRRFVLGPPLQCAQEEFPKETTFNCTYELVYWRWGLETAQRWRERLSLRRDPKWDEVLAGLSRPTITDGRYASAESAPDGDTHPRWAKDHPSMTAAFGVLPGPGVDRDAMRRTLSWIGDHWSWDDTWGWDYPMLAMSAARLGEPGRAVDLLLLDTPKNRYRENGHVHQRPGLTVYLPANGGLLYAVAMMAAGWDGAPGRHAPGFPDDGSWDVRFDGLSKAP